MDTYYIFEELAQSGANFIEIWGGPLATLTAVLISGLFGVYLFNKGVEKERNLEKEKAILKQKEETEKHNKELNRIGKYYITFLENITKSVNEQADKYASEAEKVSENYYDDFIPYSTPHENLKRILNMDFEKLFEFFDLNRFDTEEYFKIISKLDYLRIIFEQIPHDFEVGNPRKVIELKQQLVNIRILMLDKMVELNGSLLETNQVKEYNLLFATIETIVKNYYQENDGMPNVEWDYEKLIKPVKAEFLKKELRYHPFSKYILNLAKDAGNMVFSIKKLNQGIVRDMLSTINHIRKSADFINERIKIYKENLN